MVVKTVTWTDTAIRERREILNYWVKRNKSPAYSEKLVKIILERIQFIIKNPESYIKTDYKDIRTSTLGNYNIYYKVKQDELIVIAFWDNRQNPKKLLKFIRNA